MNTEMNMNLEQQEVEKVLEETGVLTMIEDELLGDEVDIKRLIPKIVAAVAGAVGVAFVIKYRQKIVEAIKGKVADIRAKRQEKKELKKVEKEEKKKAKKDKKAEKEHEKNVVQDK